MEKDKINDQLLNEQKQGPSEGDFSRRKAIKRIAGAMAAAVAASKLASARPFPAYVNYAQYSEIYGSSQHYTQYTSYYSSYHSYHSIYVPPPK